jgi:hypothetical protein
MQGLASTLLRLGLSSGGESRADVGENGLDAMTRSSNHGHRTQSDQRSNQRILDQILAFLARQQALKPKAENAYSEQHNKSFSEKKKRQ